MAAANVDEFQDVSSSQDSSNDGKFFKIWYKNYAFVIVPIFEASFFCFYTKRQ